MKINKVCPLLLILILAESIHVSRQNVDLKKDPRSKVKKRGVSREMFHDLFQVYDASFLAAVWPKITNGIHLMLDVSCWKDMSVFFKDLSEGKSWAYKAVDASGHYESGFFSGNRFWLGSKEQCDRLDGELIEVPNYNRESLQAVDYATEIRRNDRFRDYGGHDWRWVLQNELKQHQLTYEKPPLHLAYTVVELALNISKFSTPKMYNVIMGMCVPKSCSKYDIESVVNFSIMINENLKSNRTLPRTTRILSVRQIKPYGLKTDLGAIFFMGLTTILILLATIATTVELRLIKCSIYNRNAKSFDLEKFNNNDQTVNKENKIINEVASTKVDKATNVPAVKTKAAKLFDNNPVPVPINNISASQMTGSCHRCGKYKQQCSSSRPSIHSPSPPAKDFQTSKIEYQRNNTFCRLLLCFSFVYSWKKIFNKNSANKDLSLIHVLKIMATFCVMFVHVSMMVSYISVTVTDVNEHSNVYYIISIGTIAFDTLFFLSGLISSYHFFYLKSRYTVEELVNFGGRCGQILQFFCFVTNRIIRLLPSYAYVILLSVVLNRVQRDTTVLTLADEDDLNCRVYWWRNLIYVSNMYPEDQQCMQISWYLSTETQLHAVGALACAASVSARLFANMRAKLVASVTFAVLLAATAADVSAAYFDGKIFSNVLDAYSSIIDRPIARVTPYFIGVFGGWLIHATHNRLKISKVSTCVLWVVSMTLLCVSWSLPLVCPGCWLVSFVHVTWPVGLLGPVLLCSSKHAVLFRRLLSSTACGVSRLCYGAVLVHAPVARAVLLALDAAVCSNGLCLWIYYTATSVLSLLAALVLSLLVEMPCCSLLRRLSDCATS